ncbi:uncharacterized protein BT62DRAFT_1013654 [Guyanagaster necrorhizus]|uniref:Cytochrome P450 n=1 Tax=Guyanagaster necrorhizus TaxID=856835 RepID=A0A9P8ALG1_9AGAR|nr:uncharacterized protein BT62DRAFT_1013654 [Guyanagaster necrorhizus MCA 3950]KAG7439684.1 hypothetical protein BT62DRAFT_1013654 [Guyanagaster necrorhizus MCA 3950]
MRSTSQLATTSLWQILPENMSLEERIELTYARCKSVVQHFNLTANDILNVTPRYWAFLNDPLMVTDVSVATLLNIHFNLYVGTLAMYLDRRPDLKETIDRLLSFEWNGQYCLTELGHGLDIINMETTARLQPSGEFEFHPPSPLLRVRATTAATHLSDLPPAKIYVYFLAPVAPGQSSLHSLCREVSLSCPPRFPGPLLNILSPRGGAHPVKHCLMYFKNVFLPASALLGSLDRPKDLRTAFFLNISPVILAKYSLRRRVVDSYTRQPREIMSFVTQYTPVHMAIAQTLPIVTRPGKVLHELPIPKGTWLNSDVKQNAKVSLGMYGNLFTFIGGPQSCMGWRFAVCELHALMVEIIDKFEFSLTKDWIRIQRESCRVMVPTLEGEVEKGAQLPLKVNIAPR